MTNVSQPEIPFPSLDRDELTGILYGLSDYIGVHEVVFDEFGSVKDATLVWWNEAYKRIRTKPVELGQSMADTYFEPHSAFVHVQEAWDTGRSFQVFELPASVRDRYREQGVRVTMLINWQRVGDHIVEAGGDVTEYVAMQELLKDQQSLVAIASKKRALAVERQRIAHNLHDSVIQQLYAASLGLSVTARDADEVTAEKISKSIDAIAEVIDGIRREILDVESRVSPQLVTQLEDVLLPIVAPASAEFVLRLDCPRISDEFIPHIRAVCTEATSNAIRHGMAKNVEISLTQEGAHMLLRIADDGIGIDPAAPLQNGLNNMRQRAQSMGGTMKVRARDGGGTVIEWTVPHPGWES
jgi:signal transduction histidine kinase